MKDIVYIKKGEISQRPLGNELMLYDKASDKIHVLNETGAILWNLLDGSKSISDLENAIAVQFKNIPLDQVATDTRELLENLVKEKLIIEAQ